MLSSTPSLAGALSPSTPRANTTSAAPKRRSPSHSPSHSLSALHTRKPSISKLPSKLQAVKVIGTTASSHTMLSVVCEFVAHTAGAGAVLLNLNTKQQRFFCTSSKIVHNIQQSVATSSSVPAWLAEVTQNCQSPVRDKHGYLIGTDSDTSVQNTGLGINNEELNNLAGAKLTPAKDKMKGASCVSLSPDGSLLAVGGTGHQPRVFIYSTALNSSSSTPLAILCEHRYGIKLVSFSPCGKFLATLGTTSDGFLHVWNLANLKEGNVSLHSSNRCISMVHDMKWIGSSTVVTAGVRHIRLWKVENKNGNAQWTDTKANVLQGRNMVLNDFSNSVFTCIAPLSANMALVATERGDIATLQDNEEEKPGFVPRVSTKEDIAAMDIDLDSHALWIAGSCIKSIGLEDLLEAGPIPVSGTSRRPTPKYRAIGVRPNSMVTLTSERDIFVGDECIVSAHAQELKGIRKVGQDSFLTFSSDGMVRVWDNQGCKTALYTVNMDDDLTVAYMDQSQKVLITGDKSGNVRITEGGSAHDFVAHSSSVVGIDYYSDENIEMVVTCSRDRTVQVFLKQNVAWELHQTLPAHKAHIQCVYFTSDGERIVSCSADRTVAIHKFVRNGDDAVFVSDKVISTKSTPLDMCLSTGNRVVVSTDKQIMVYKPSGDFATSYRCCDGDGDGVNLYSISIGISNGVTYLAGVGQDKGIRVYDHSTGAHIGTDWGHSEGVSNMTWVSNDTDCKILSSGHDGCIFMWQVVNSEWNGECPAAAAAASSTTRATSPTPPRVSPTRKILSKQELAKFMSGTSNNRSSTPTLTPTRKPMLPRAATTTPTNNNNTSRRKSLQSSKSMHELKPKRAPETPPVETAETMASIDENGGHTDNAMDALLDNLARFRRNFNKRDNDSDPKLDKLRHELRTTLHVVDDSCTDDLVERFGSRLLHLVDQRLSNNNNDNKENA